MTFGTGAVDVILVLVPVLSVFVRLISCVQFCRRVARSLLMLICLQKEKSALLIYSGQASFPANARIYARGSHRIYWQRCDAAGL